MTRLITDWIKDMEVTASQWDIQLKQMTGMGYIELAAECSACDGDAACRVAEIKAAAMHLKVAAVPITSGLGVIGSFAESVASIVSAMGFETFVTEAADVNGLYEARLRGADICFMADDERYIALNFNNGRIGDNNVATARGYAKLLEAMAVKNVSGGRKPDPSMHEKYESGRVAVLGYGIIGQLMAKEMTERGASVTVFETDESRLAEAADAGFATGAAGFVTGAAGFATGAAGGRLADFACVADCTNTGGWLNADALHKDAVIAAPGIPLSLNGEAAEKFEGRYVHDMLEIGTAVMLGLVI